MDKSKKEKSSESFISIFNNSINKTALLIVGIFGLAIVALMANSAVDPNSDSFFVANGSDGVFLTGDSSVNYANLSNGDRFFVNVAVQYDAAGVNAVETKLDYNQNRVRAVSVSAYDSGTNLLMAYQNINNSSGRIEFDIAKIGSNFSGLETIAQVEFEVVNRNQNTTIEVANGTRFSSSSNTYGNFIRGTFPVNFVASSSSTSTVSSSSSSSSTSGTNSIRMLLSIVNNTTSIDVGDTVKLQVSAGSISSGSVLAGVQSTLSYDATKLEFLQMTQVNGITLQVDQNPSSQNGLNLLYFDSAATSQSGYNNNQVMYELEFRALASSSNSPTTVDITETTGLLNDQTVSVNTNNSGSEVSISISNSVPRSAFQPAHVIPNPIPAYEFDFGNNSEAYYDITPGNSGTAIDLVSLRGNNSGGADVDFVQNNGTVKVSDFQPSEWLEFTVKANSNFSGSLQFKIKLESSSNDPEDLAIDINGTRVGKAFVRNFSGFTYATFTGVQVPQGTHIVRVTNLGNTDFEFEQLQFGNLPNSCQGDYSGNGTIDFEDLLVFASKYNQSQPNCDYDVIGGNCRLDIVDLQVFARDYRVNNICAL